MKYFSNISVFDLKKLERIINIMDNNDIFILGEIINNFYNLSFLLKQISFTR